MTALREGDLLDDRYMVWTTEPLSYYDTVKGEVIKPLTFEEWACQSEKAKVAVSASEFQ